MWRCRVLPSVLVLFLATVLLVGCTPSAAKKTLQNAGPALSYLAKVAQNDALIFDAGPYRGGTAIIGSNEEAFWVKDGKPYVVNEKAKKIAPELEQAPGNIQFNDEFKAAAQTDK